MLSSSSKTKEYDSFSVTADYFNSLITVSGTSDLLIVMVTSTWAESWHKSLNVDGKTERVLMLGWDEGSKFLHRLCRHHFFCEVVPLPVRNRSKLSVSTSEDKNQLVQFPQWTRSWLHLSGIVNQSLLIPTL